MQSPSPPMRKNKHDPSSQVSQQYEVWEIRPIWFGGLVHGNLCTSAVRLFSCELITAVPHMGSRWDKSNPFPKFTKLAFVLWKVLADSAGITVAWEVELPH